MMTDMIIPRWEWRDFATDFGDIEARLQANAGDEPRHSDEIYLLSAFNDANVKIRGGLLEIKRLEQTGAHGFELWQPVLKAAFPLLPADSQAVFTTLGVAPPLRPGSTTLERLLLEVSADSRLRAVEVHKARTPCRVGGCIAELAEVIVNGSSLRTIAVESENPEDLAATLRSLGLEATENVSYPRGLKRLVGWPAEG